MHDFRVALRRLRTVLRVARMLYGRRRMRSIARGLRRFAAATGALRDEEVLRETLASLDLPTEAKVEVERWTARRARGERALRADVARALDPTSVPRAAREPMPSYRSVGARQLGRGERSTGGDVHLVVDARVVEAVPCPSRRRLREPLAEHLAELRNREVEPELVAEPVEVGRRLLKPPKEP